MSKLIVFSALAASIVAATAFTPVSAAGYDSNLNKPSYWGDNCVKTEMKGEVKTYTATGENITKVIVKGGTENAVYTSGDYTDLTAPTNSRSDKPYGISHVIVCYSAQTTPETPTTPEKPSKPEKPTPPAVGGDQDGVIETDDQTSSSTTKPTPQVLGTSQVKGGSAPESLPETGASSNTSLITLLAAIIASMTAYAVALKRQA